MRKLIYVGELISTGKIGKYGRYFPPYVKINTPEDYKLNIIIDEVDSEIILAIPFKYREATTFIDIPVFKVTLFDENDEKIDEIQTAVPPKDYVSKIEFFEQTDTYARWNFFDSEFRIRLNPSDIPIGETVDPIKFKIRMIVTLRRWKRPSLEQYHFGAPPEDFPHNIEDPISFEAWAPTEVKSLTKERWITVCLKGLSFKPGIYIDSIWPFDGLENGDYKFYIHDANYKFKWALARRGLFAPLEMVHERDSEEITFGLQPYEFNYKIHTNNIEMGVNHQIIFLIRNLSDKTITGWDINLIDFKSIDDEEVKNYFNGISSTFPTPTNFTTIEYKEHQSYNLIPPGGTYLYSTKPSFNKEWIWFQVKSLEWWQAILPDLPSPLGGERFELVKSTDFYDLYETEKIFRYYVSEMKFTSNDGTISILAPEKIAYGRFNVYVPRNKINALRKWGFKSDDDRDVAANYWWLDIAILIAGIITPYALVLEIPAVTTHALTWLTKESYDYLLVEAVDPIRIDDKFEIIQDYTELIKEPTEIENIPYFLTRFLRINTNLVALSQTIEITVNRYVTALLFEDLNHSKLQYEHSEFLISKIEELVLLLNEDLQYVQHMMELYAENLAKEDLTEIFEILKADGLPEEFVNLKIDEGCPEEVIEKIQNVVKNIKYDEVFNRKFFLDFIRHPLKIYNNAADSFIKSLRKIEIIRRLYLIGEVDILNELLKFGLINNEEYQQKFLKASKDQIYPLKELQFIEDKYKIRLKNLCILNTAQLLYKCSTKYRRAKLAQRIEMEQVSLLKMANIADLMRVNGLHEYHAVILEHLGVDTVIELSKRNPTNLYEEIIETFQNVLVKGFISKSTVIDWIEMAKLMKRVLKY